MATCSSRCEIKPNIFYVNACLSEATCERIFFISMHSHMTYNLPERASPLMHITSETVTMPSHYQMSFLVFVYTIWRVWSQKGKRRFLTHFTSQMVLTLPLKFDLKSQLLFMLVGSLTHLHVQQREKGPDTRILVYLEADHYECLPMHCVQGQGPESSLSICVALK